MVAGRLSVAEARVADADVVSAEVMLSTTELEAIVSEWLANKVGMAKPIAYRLAWLWSPGMGPVVRVHVESVENVVPLFPSKPFSPNGAR